MRMPDVNVLIYAHREEDPDHPFYQNWLEDLINGPEPFALSPLVAVAFVRIVTHPSFSSSPTPLPQALSVIDSLRSSPHHRSPGPGPHHWDLTKLLCEKTSATGKRVADAQHAALAIENGCAWVTRDPDFQEFTRWGLRLEILEPNS